MAGNFGNTYGGGEIRKHLTWASLGSSSTGIADDASTEIEIPLGTSHVLLQVATTSATHSSSDIDINVQAGFTNSDGSDTWDTQPYNDDIQALSPAVVKTVLINPGASKIRFTADNNDAETADITATVTLRSLV